MLTGLGPALERGLDLAGVFVFALSGATLARRKGFDLVGLVVLAMVTALGGGVLRDLLLGEAPPAALRDQWYLWSALGASGVVFLAGGLVDRLDRPVLVFDAAGVGLFCVVGTAKSLAAGLGVVPSVLLGTITAVGGGVVRDVLARDVPSIFRADNALYAIPAAAGGGATAALWGADAFGPAAACGIALGVFVVRLLAMRHDWRAPTGRGA